MAERGTTVNRRAFPDQMQIIVRVGVKQEFAGVKKIELPQHPGFGPLGTLDQGADFSMTGRKPHHHPGTVGDRKPPQNQRLILCDYGSVQAHGTGGLRATFTEGGRQMFPQSADLNGKIEFSLSGEFPLIGFKRVQQDPV